MSLQSDLDKIESIKKDIHSSIIGKGVTIPSDEPFANYPQAITSIEGASDISNSHVVVKINVHPANATVVFTCLEQSILVVDNMITMPRNKSLTYTVSCNHYVTQSNTITPDTNMEIEVHLVRQGSNVKKFIACPKNIQLVLTLDGDLYVCGASDEYSGLPDASGNPIASLTLVKSNVKDVYPYSSSYLYINEDDELWYVQQWNTDPREKKVADNVKEVKTSINAVFYIDWEGKLYGFGDYMNGGTIDSPMLLASNIKDYDLNFTLRYYITSDNNLYMSGYNSNCEIDDTGSECNSFTLVSHDVDYCKIPTFDIYNGAIVVSSSIRRIYNGTFISYKLNTGDVVVRGKFNNVYSRVVLNSGDCLAVDGGYTDSLLNSLPSVLLCSHNGSSSFSSYNCTYGSIHTDLNDCNIKYEDIKKVVAHLKSAEYPSSGNTTKGWIFGRGYFVLMKDGNLYYSGSDDTADTYGNSPFCGINTAGDKHLALVMSNVKDFGNIPLKNVGKSYGTTVKTCGVQLYYAITNDNNLYVWNGRYPFGNSTDLYKLQYLFGKSSTVNFINVPTRVLLPGDVD